MVEKFEQFLAATLDVGLDADGCGEDGLYGYLLYTIPQHRGSQSRRGKYSVDLAQRSREFFRSMVECFEGMHLEYRTRVRIEFEAQHARNVLDIYLSMPDCCSEDEVLGRIHTWPAWLGLQIHGIWLFTSGYFSNLTHPDPEKRDRKFDPVNTLGCFFSGWWYAYLMWCEGHAEHSARLISWLTDYSDAGQPTYHNLAPLKLISESYRHTVSASRATRRLDAAATSQANDPILFLKWLLGRLDHFRQANGKDIEPLDYHWVLVDKATKRWPKTLTNIDDCAIADSATLSWEPWKIKGGLSTLAEKIFEMRAGRGGCVRVARNVSYTPDERNAEIILETGPDFHKTVLFNWPFLLRPPCQGKK